VKRKFVYPTLLVLGFLMWGTAMVITAKYYNRQATDAMSWGQETGGRVDALGKKVTLNFSWSMKQDNNLSPLAQLTNLEHLSVTGSEVSDLTPLKNLTRLEEL
jgi:hypothetical protein